LYVAVDVATRTAWQIGIRFVLRIATLHLRTSKAAVATPDEIFLAPNGLLVGLCTENVKNGFNEIFPRVFGSAKFEAKTTLYWLPYPLLSQFSGLWYVNPT